MKIFRKALTTLLTVFIILMAAVIGVSLFTRQKNYGVPKIFGYQFMIVLTDSMEPTLEVGTMIFVKEVEMSEFRPQEINPETNEIIYDGDIVTFFNRNIREIVTHRLIDVKVNDGQYQFTTTGDNKSYCTGGVCAVDTFYEQDVLGKVVGHSDAVGAIYRAISHPVAIILIIILPAGYLIISTIIDYNKQKDKGEDSNEEV